MYKKVVQRGPVYASLNFPNVNIIQNHGMFIKTENLVHFRELNNKLYLDFPSFSNNIIFLSQDSSQKILQHCYI